MIVWDEPKHLAEHGLYFAEFEASFSWDDHVIVLDGERAVVAVVSPLGSEGLSLVSLRPASRQERALHDLRR